MDNKLNGGKRLCVRRDETSPYERWRASDSNLAQIAFDPYAATEANTQSDALAETAKLYNLNGALMWLDGGKLVRVLPAILPQIILRHIATERLVQRPGGDWVTEFEPYVPNERILHCLLMPDRRAGGLLERVSRQ